MRMHVHAEAHTHAHWHMHIRVDMHHRVDTRRLGASTLHAHEDAHAPAHAHVALVWTIQMVEPRWSECPTFRKVHILCMHIYI